MIEVTGTLKQLAKHTRRPMSGVTLTPGSNTNPNHPFQGIVDDVKSNLLGTSFNLYSVMIWFMITAHSLT